MNEMITRSKIEELLRQIEADRPRLNAVKKTQLERFYSLRPDRCGIIDFLSNEVQYDETYYTEGDGNYDIKSIEDWLRIFDIVGLDYELRIADIFDPTDCFSIKYANTKADHKKYGIALELHSLYCKYYSNLLDENGIDANMLNSLHYWRFWSGCEKEIEPEKYSEDNLLLCDDQIMDILNELYPKAVKNVLRRS